ncbi:hypothetical protein [Lysobacter gummosus]|uniref:hypothetical protein n=1 Tax=Lysobacter gummosus TaxID=262324 RepID=UPI003625EE49
MDGGEDGKDRALDGLSAAPQAQRAQQVSPTQSGREHRGRVACALSSGSARLDRKTPALTAQPARVRRARAHQRPPITRPLTNKMAGASGQMPPDISALQFGDICPLPTTARQPVVSLLATRPCTGDLSPGLGLRVTSMMDTVPSGGSLSPLEENL